MLAQAFLEAGADPTIHIGGELDFIGGSTSQILLSLKRLVELEGNLRVCPGHDRITDLDTEREHNPYVRQALR